MPPATTLQTQFPLSPKKFKKKMLVAIVPFAFMSFLVNIPIGLSTFYFTGNDNSSPFFTVWLGGSFVCFVVSMCLKSLYTKAYIRRYYYDATDNYITIKKGVFAPAEIHIQYAKIQDVYVDQDILDRILGLYDVHLASATVVSGMEAHIDGVEQEAAEGLKNLLLQRIVSGGGGASPSMGSDPNPSTESVANVLPPVAFQNEISSRTYPIADAWMLQQAVVWIFSSVLVSAYLMLQLSSFWLKRGNYSVFGELLLPFIGIFISVYACHLLYSVLWRSNFSFNFLPDYLMTKQGIIAKNETHLPYRAVQDVSVSQGIIERMLGIATVVIENAGSQQAVASTQFGGKGTGITLPGQPLARANEISNAIKQVTLTKSSAHTGL